MGGQDRPPLRKGLTSLSHPVYTPVISTTERNQIVIWPTSKIIHVTRALIDGIEVGNAFAVRDSDGDYFLIDGKYEGTFVTRSSLTRKIIQWDDTIPIPADTINALRTSFQGVKLPAAQQAALQEAISYLPAHKPTPLEKAKLDLDEKLSDIGYTTRFDRMMKLLIILTAPSKSGAYLEHLITIAAIAAAGIKAELYDNGATGEITNKAAALLEENAHIDFQDICNSISAMATKIQQGQDSTPELLNVAAKALALASKHID